MLKNVSLKQKSNITIVLLSLALAFVAALTFSLTARADSPDEAADWVDWDTVAAQSIGVDGDALFDEMIDGKTSIAGVAAAHGVETQQVVDAIVAAEKEWLTQQVTKGTISQKEADEMVATESELREEVRAYLEEEDVFAFEEGDFSEGVDWLSVAAKTIGVDDETLFNEWDESKSLADVAKAHNVDPQKVIDAVVAAEKEQVVQLLADDVISQDEADEWLAELENEAVFFVKVTGWVDWVDVAAKTIGVKVEALFQAEGKSVADVAAAHNVEAQTVIDAIVAAEENWLKTQVANGAFSQSAADEWWPADTMAEEARFFVEQTGYGEEFDAEFMDSVDWLDVAAKTIGVDNVEVLFNEWDAGKSLAEVAQAHNVDPQTVIDALVAAEKTWLDEQVANKVLTQAEADEWASPLAEDARSFVEMKDDVYETGE